MWQITLITILIVLFFAGTILFYFVKELKKSKASQFTADLIFRRYNKKIEKIKKIFSNDKLNAELDVCKLQIQEGNNLTEISIYNNISNIDKLEDNNVLLNEIKKEFKSRGMVQSRVNLLKKPVILEDLSSFKCSAKHPKHRAILEFKENLKTIELQEKFKKVLSATECYSFGNVYMFLPSKVLKLDLENIFAVEYINYEKFGIRVWLFKEDEVDFDGSYDLADTEYSLPADVNLKAKVKCKTYVLSFTFNDITYDITQSEVLKSRQEKMDKLCKQKF